MHTYAPWRLWLVFATLVLGLLLALPNVFGDAPALQLSRNDRTPAPARPPGSRTPSAKNPRRARGRGG